MSELRLLAKTCNFGNYLDTALRDQFVCGLKDLQIQRELLCTRELTVSQALEKGRSMKAVLKESKNFHQDEESVEPQGVHKGSMHKLTKDPQPSPSCYRCGGTGHSSDSCYHRNRRCHN